MIDAVRLAKLAMNNGVAGALEGPSAYLMKSPHVQIQDDDAHDAVERFIEENPSHAGANDGRPTGTG